MRQHYRRLCLKPFRGRGCPKQINIFAGMAELADAQDLGSCVNSCRFDPCYPHHISTVDLIKSAVEIFLCIALIYKAFPHLTEQKANRYGVKSIAVLCMSLKILEKY